MQEEQIIAGLKAKDRETIEYLYDKYSGALFGVICKTVSNQEIAEEVFHCAFMSIILNIDRYNRNEGRFYSWMALICRRYCHDMTRTNKEPLEN